jgi:hypothetical protein
MRRQAGMSSHRRNFWRRTDDENRVATKVEDAGPPSRPVAARTPSPVAPMPRTQGVSHLSFADDDDDA